jgi:hypothetical protein
MVYSKNVIVIKQNNKDSKIVNLENFILLKSFLNFFDSNTQKNVCVGVASINKKISKMIKNFKIFRNSKFFQVNL